MGIKEMNESQKRNTKKPFQDLSPKKPLTSLQKNARNWLRKNVPTKSTKILHRHVEYFTASKAIDALLNDSPWGRIKTDKDAINKSELIFGTREQCVGFLEELLQHKMFHRAKKIPVAVKTSNKDKKEKNKVTDQEEEEKEPAKSKGKDDRDKSSASL